MCKVLNLCFLAVLVLVLRSVDGLECYNCSDVASVATCNTVMTCPDESFCHTEYSTVGSTRLYTLACREKSLCPSASHATWVGRAVTMTTCSECCNTGMCNRQLCQHDYPGCTDATDCSLLGSSTNVCFDTQHAKNVCRHFCGLCSLVDGNWSVWSTWSSCNHGTITRSRACDNPAPSNSGDTCYGSSTDIAPCATAVRSQVEVAGGWSDWASWGVCSKTCDIGLQHRLRSCSNPPPANGGPQCQGFTHDTRLCFPGACENGGWSQWDNWGTCSPSSGGEITTRSRTCTDPPPSLAGKYCEGNNMEAKSCTLQTVAGVWSSWAAWGACSVTCDIGQQRRQRTCSAPPPSNGGAQCLGNSFDIKICIRKACAVAGDWSAWAAWEHCSVSCDIGEQRRQRTCTNPAPSNGGAQCLGNTVDTKLCFPGACTDGGWSMWGNWGTCTRTCGGGVSTRSRTCTKPPPSLIGRYCEGDHMEAESCNIRACVDSVAFMVHGINNANFLTNNTHLNFSTIQMNLGNGWKTSDGRFHVPVGGTYQFTAQICTTKVITVKLLQNGNIRAPLSSRDQSVGGACTSVSVLQKLLVGDVVWMDFDSGDRTGFVEDTYMWNSFSGVLLYV